MTFQTSTIFMNAFGLVIALTLSSLQGAEPPSLVANDRGEITISPGQGIQSYRFQWAAQIDGPWYDDWSPLQNIIPSGVGPIVVQAPRFFRAVATPIPEPRNYVQGATTLHANLVDGEARGEEQATHDESGDTFYGAYRHHGGDGSVRCSIQSQHVWPAPAKIDRISAKMYANPLPYGNYPRSEYAFQIWIQADGEWKLEYSDAIPFGDGAREQSRDVTLEKGWERVTGVRVFVLSVAYSYEGNRQQETFARIYDIKAIGQ